MSALLAEPPSVGEVAVGPVPVGLKLAPLSEPPAVPETALSVMRVGEAVV